MEGMRYDVAAKVVLSRCKSPVLSLLCGLPVTSASLIEAKPQETASLRRSDFVFRATFEEGSERLILLEFLSYWKTLVPVRTLECRCRHLLEEKFPVVTVLLLLRPCPGAVECYRDEEVRYTFRLVRVYEFEAREILEKGPACLYPFLPLMKGGEELVDEADRRIYEGEFSREEKADLLTGLAIFGGFISKDIPRKLLERRRDLMIESAAYEIIKGEGLREGFEKGLREGMEKGRLEGLREGIEMGRLEGFKEGIEKGRREGLLRGIILSLKFKFGKEASRLFPRLERIEDVRKLEVISGALEVVESLEEIEKLMD